MKNDHKENKNIEKVTDKNKLCPRFPLYANRLKLLYILSISFLNVGSHHINFSVLFFTFFLRFFFSPYLSIFHYLYHMYIFLIPRPAKYFFFFFFFLLFFHCARKEFVQVEKIGKDLSLRKKKGKEGQIYLLLPAERR